MQIKPLEFVDDIADPNSGNANAVLSNDIICNIQRRKRLKFSTKKCKLLKVNSKDNGDTISISGEKVEIKMSFRYLGDIFNYHGDNSDLCKERARKAIGTSTEIISLCKEINFGKNQISEMLLLYHSVFLPRLVYNCEAWTNLTCKDYSCLENVQKNFLRHVMEVPKSTPTSGLFLEMGILPVQFVIEVRQLMFLKKIIARDPSDHVKEVYLEMLKYPGENNWANNVLDLRCKYNLPQKDENVNNLTMARLENHGKKSGQKICFSNPF